MSEILKKNKAFINKNSWLLVFVLAYPFFNDGYRTVQLIDDWIMDYFKVMMFVVMLVFFVLKKIKPSPLIISLAAIEGWWLISTLLNYPLSERTVYHKQTIDMINALSVGLIVECFKDQPKSLFSGLILSLELCVYPNLFTVFGHTGDYTYLLGPYTTIILWTLPATCVAGLYMYFHQKYIRGILLVIACYYTTIQIWCATNVVAFMGMSGIFLLGVLMMRIKRFEKFKIPLSLLFTLSFAGVVFVLFVYTGHSNYPLVDFFIEKILRKTTTFTDRTVIWQAAIEMIKKKPIAGYGFRPEIGVVNSYGDAFLHAHNQILQRLTATGIVGTVLFIIFHIVLSIKSDKGTNTIARLIGVACSFAVSITYMTEAYKKFFRFYLIYFLTYHVEEMIRKSLDNKDELLK